LPFEQRPSFELEALKAGVAESDADPRVIAHEDMRAWILKLADGDFKAAPPVARGP
jgi:Fe-S-cluster formation regulator IscX/YfhJ